jgi:OOP family OmpA-OmpF porin
MQLTKILSAVAGLAFLAGCTATEVDQLRMAEPKGSAFTQALAEEYQQIATFEADEMYDWIDATYFARKGLRAADGEVVLPEEVANWKLTKQHAEELSAARTRLMTQLEGGARTSNPTEAARAQGRFDCWIEQQEENHQPDHIAACRDAFIAAMENLETVMEPAPEPTPEPMEPVEFVVYFGFDKDNLTAEAQSVLDRAVAEGGTDAEYSVTGHADRAGPEDYNLGLSLRRANSVREYLVGKGVPKNNLSLAGRGESEPAVQTPDGVPEQANRRVEIVIQ